MKLTEHPNWNSKLCKEWDHSKNSSPPESYTAGSGKKVWWSCEDCKYNFESIIKNRVTRGGGCSLCSGDTTLAGVNDLEFLKPEIARYWSSENSLKPSQVRPYSHRKFKWECDEEHITISAPAHFSRLGRFSCSECYKEGFLLKPGSTIKELPEHLRNQLSDKAVKAFDGVVLKTRTVLEWDCEVGHGFKQSIQDRVLGKQCGYCSGQRLLKGFNDLQTTHPDSLTEWDYEKNFLLPSEISAGGSYRAWWRCKRNNHSWKALVTNRVKKNSGCPYCIKSSSKLELEVLEELRTITKENIEHSNRTIIAPLELDFYIPSLNLAIEANGDYWHSDEKLLINRGVTSLEYHTLKEKLCDEKGVTLLFIWESDWKENREKVLQDLSNYLLTGVKTLLLSSKTSPKQY